MKRSSPGTRIGRWRLAAIAVALPLLAGLGWAALAPVQAMSREELFEIPNGTAARRLAGEEIEILPHTIRLTLGLNDILVFRNADSAPHIFGPTLIMPCARAGMGKAALAVAPMDGQSIAAEQKSEMSGAVPGRHRM